MAHPPLFPALDSGAPLADVQVRQTLAMGLIPLGIALLLMAAGAPDRPPAGLWAGAGVAVGGMALMWSRWRRAAGRYQRGFAVLHFLVRYLFIALCPFLLWSVYGAVVLELAGVFPPLLLGLLLLVYPVTRILAEFIGADPLSAPHVEMAHIVCQQLLMVLGVAGVTGLISGAVLDANRDYPTDPAPLLILLWLFALLGVLAGVVIGYAHWLRLFRKREPPQALDDVPPPAAPARPAPFGSDRF